MCVTKRQAYIGENNGITVEALNDFVGAVTAKDAVVTATAGELVVTIFSEERDRAAKPRDIENVLAASSVTVSSPQSSAKI